MNRTYSSTVTKRVVKKSDSPESFCDRSMVDFEARNNAQSVPVSHCNLEAHTTNDRFRTIEWLHHVLGVARLLAFRRYHRRHGSWHGLGHWSNFHSSFRVRKLAWRLGIRSRCFPLLD